MKLIAAILWGGFGWLCFEAQHALSFGPAVQLFRAGTMICFGAAVFNVFWMFMDRSEPAGNFVMNIGPFLRTEPERGRGGSVIVYRWNEAYMENGKVRLRGANGGDWSKWQLEADGVPDEDNTNGIYGCHDPNDVELDNYKTGHSVLVRVELRGQKAIHKRGSRGQVGTVIDVLEAEPGVPEQLTQLLRKRGFAV